MVCMTHCVHDPLCVQAIPVVSLSNSTQSRRLRIAVSIFCFSSVTWPLVALCLAGISVLCVSCTHITTLLSMFVAELGCQSFAAKLKLYNNVSKIVNFRFYEIIIQIVWFTNGWLFLHTPSVAVLKCFNAACFPWVCSNASVHRLLLTARGCCGGLMQL